MNVEKNDIDQLVKDATNSIQASPYQSVYWDEMDVMLNAKDTAKKKFLIVTFSDCLASLLVIALITLNLTPTSTTNQRYFSTYLALNTAEVEQAELTDLATNINLNFHTSNRSKNTVSSHSTLPKHIENKKNFINNNVSEKRKIADVKQLNKTSALLNNTNSTRKLNNINSSNTKVTPTSIKKLEKEFSTLAIRKQKIFSNPLGDKLKNSMRQTPRSDYSLFLQLSGGLMENYKTKRPYESGAFSFSLGFEKQFKSGFLVRSGIGTQLITNADLIVSRKAKVTDFGIVKQQNNLSYQKLLDLYIPIGIGYSYNRYSFGTEIQLNYLFSSLMNLNKYKNQVLVSSKRFYGNTNGLNHFSMQGHIWFAYQLSSRFFVEARIGTSLTSRIKEGYYFNNSATTNPLYGQISIRYALLK